MEAQAAAAREDIKAARLAQKKAADAAAEKSRLAVEKLAREEEEGRAATELARQQEAIANAVAAALAEQTALAE